MELIGSGPHKFHLELESADLFIHRATGVYTLSFSAPVMFLRFLLGELCLLCALTAGHAETDCPALPVFSPSLLVVKYGDPAFATCSICNGSCPYDLRLEDPVASNFKNGSQIIWDVRRLEQWSLQLYCFIFDTSCDNSLDVTVYQPPESVSLSFRDLSGPLVEGRRYSLQCDVRAVAPAQNITVAFYRGHMELLVQGSSTQQKTPVNESFSLDYRMSREDHGTHFWCEARLELGPEGPQPPPVVRSQNITANVLYAPYSDVSAETQLLTVVQGQSVELDCSSDGNPSPHYSWSVPSDTSTLFSDSVFIIHSASNQHEGLYSCNASNSEGSLRRSFPLVVRDLPVQEIDFPAVTMTPPKNRAEDWSVPCLTVTVSICLWLYSHVVAGL